MRELQLPIRSQEWMRQIFAAKSARDGGVIRRKVSDVERLVGRDVFLATARMRGYRVVENAGHFVVFCNSDDVVLRL